MTAALNTKERVANKITSETGLSSSVTDEEYPSAKTVYGGLAKLEEQVYKALQDMDILPKGTILAMTVSSWINASATFQSKWKVCDGTGGTPNLTGRFLRGGTASDSPTGGANSQTVSVPVPQHYHSITDPGHTHNLLYNFVQTGENGGNSKFYRSTQSGNTGVLTRDATGITKTNDAGTAGASITINITPSYYTVIYIVKMA
jgi:hypothetical protein